MAWSSELSNGSNRRDHSTGLTAEPQHSACFRSLEFVQEKWQSWILLNASWSSKWWYSTVHNITAIVGAGVLSLPAAMAFLSWELGTFALLFFIVLSLTCYWQIIGMHEIDGKRFDRYHELGQHVLGENLGFWLVVPLQLLVEIGVDTVYIITGASSLSKIGGLPRHEAVILDDHFRLRSTLSLTTSTFCIHHLGVFHGSSDRSRVTLYILLNADASFLAFVFHIMFLNFNRYSTIAWIAVLLQHTDKVRASAQLTNKARPGSFSHGYPHGSAAYITFGVFSALGKFAFACAAGHNVAMEIQATIPSTRERPSKVAMWNGVFTAYSVITACYLPVALAGYWLYGNQLPKSCLNGKLRDCHLLLVLNRPKGLIIIANVLVFLHMCGSYQVYAMPLFDTLETFIEEKVKIKPTFSVRFIARSAYVGFTLFLAATLPFFGDLQTLIGGFAIMATTYVIPSVIWHLARRPRTLSLSWLGNMVCISSGIILMIASTVGGVHNLIVNAKNYRLYQ